MVANKNDEQPFFPHQILASVSHAVTVGQIKGGQLAAERQHRGRSEYHNGPFLEKNERFIITSHPHPIGYFHSISTSKRQQHIVIPAKAGIQPLLLQVVFMDSRFRGNDGFLG
jgi:hypothetical protein